MTSAAFAHSVAKLARNNLPFQKQIFGILRTLGVRESVYRHLPVHGWIRIKTRSGSFQMFSYGDILENLIFWGHEERGIGAASFRIWERLAAAADGAVLDIGANTGVYALMARTVNAGVPVMAFEPVVRIATKLARNIARNGYDIEIVAKAVSDHDGTATFHDSASPTATTNAYSASLEPAFAFNDQAYEVEVVALDSFIDQRQRVSLIKLDVELHEVSAVRGMMGLLERDHPSILVEVLNDDIASGLRELLAPLGYGFYPIEDRRGLHVSDRPRALGEHDLNNLICMPSAIEALSDLIVERESPIV